MKLLGGEGSGVAEKRDNESRGNRENAVEPKRHRTRLVSIVTFLLALETAGFLSLALLQWLRGDLFERVSIPGIGPSPFILIAFIRQSETRLYLLDHDILYCSGCLSESFGSQVGISDRAARK
jgi:hypothetical protein